MARNNPNDPEDKKRLADEQYVGRLVAINTLFGEHDALRAILEATLAEHRAATAAAVNPGANPALRAADEGVENVAGKPRGPGSRR